MKPDNLPQISPRDVDYVNWHEHTAPDVEDEADELSTPPAVEPFDQWFARRNSPPILPDY